MKLWCCPYFMREVHAAIAESEVLSELLPAPHPFSCRHDLHVKPDRAESFLHSFRCGNDNGIIMGGGCLCNKSEIENLGPDISIISPKLCFSLVAPASIVESLTSGGAYLLTPGWLMTWKKQIADMGFDRNTAREFFHETTRRLILLDTGVYRNCRNMLLSMGEYLELPVEAIPVGIDMLKINLERVVVEKRHKLPSQNNYDQLFADQFMVIDLMNTLMSSGTESEAVMHMEELFSMFFAPGKLEYTSYGSDISYPAILTDDHFAWTDSGNGFYLSLEYEGEHLGLLLVDDLKFSEYKERYLAFALPLARLCSTAIHAARAQDGRRKSEFALRQMASIVESSDDAIIGKNLDGIIVSWNKGARRIYGYFENEVIGKHISFLTPDDYPDEIPRLLEKIKMGETTDQIETVWISKSGELRNVSLQVSTIRDENDRVVGASSIARDITADKKKRDMERKSLETQLQQSQKLESIGRLAGGVAHDFNNMLAVIIGYASLLIEDTPDDSELYMNLDEILQAAERAKGMTRQLLAFARKQILEKANLDLNTVITDFAKMLGRLIGEDISISLKLDGNIPEINADNSMMEQILLNLAVNARDAMPEGGTLTIETGRVIIDHDHAASKLDVVPGEYLMLAVSDTGTGMDAATKQRIFEPFFTTKEAGKGTGLGLATVYGIVNQHEGSIWVYSEPGHGTIFKIYFPVAGGGKITDKKLMEELSLSVGGETILVVEDEKNLRNFISSALTRSGYRVISAGSPAEALKLVIRYSDVIDLLFTDVVMPQMNGKDLYETIVKSRPDMKVLFMSGYTENVISEKGVLKDGVDFIQKPFSTRQLLHKLTLLFSNAGG